MHHPGLRDMHRFAKDFLTTFLMTAPVAGRILNDCPSRGPLARPASSRYTSQLPVAMSLVGLKQYGDDYGSSSDDCGPDDAPNSWADDDAPHEEGPVSAINCCAKKFIFHTL